MKLPISLSILFIFLGYKTSVLHSYKLVPSSKETFLSTDSNNCGYNSCNKVFVGDEIENYNKTLHGGREILNVHIIPHSHDDTGWLKTVDQYYSGSNRARFSESEQNHRVGVQYILDTVVKQLLFDPMKKWIQVEIAFFWRWWQEQDEKMRSEVHHLVQNGQLEFINGGWCMNDEAAAHYTDIIHQMSLGMRFLNDTFGECAMPKVAWQIDPFGHSKEQANLFAEMAFDGMFFGRLDYRDKQRRMSANEMEMIWYSNAHHTQSLFTGVLYNGYSPPPGYCWDILCPDMPIVDDDESHAYNVDERVNGFVSYAKAQGLVLIIVSCIACWSEKPLAILGICCEIPCRLLFQTHRPSCMQNTIIQQYMC